MVYEYVTQDWQLGFERRDLAVIGFEGGTETLEGGWGVQFRDFELDLVRYKFALEVYNKLISSLVSSGFRLPSSYRRGGRVQCSCLPVRV